MHIPQAHSDNNPLPRAKNKGTPSSESCMQPGPLACCLERAGSQFPHPFIRWRCYIFCLSSFEIELVRDLKNGVENNM